MNVEQARTNVENAKLNFFTDSIELLDATITRVSKEGKTYFSMATLHLHDIDRLEALFVRKGFTWRVLPAERNVGYYGASEPERIEISWDLPLDRADK